jgi:hypothetical protein
MQTKTGRSIKGMPWMYDIPECIEEVRAILQDWEIVEAARVFCRTRARKNAEHMHRLYEQIDCLSETDKSLLIARIKGIA